MTSDKAEERAMRQREEAHRLALWLLEDERHPDFSHYCKVMYDALEWGATH